MLIGVVGPRLLTAENAVLDVLPVGRRDIRRLDSDLLKRVDKHEQYLHPAPSPAPQARRISTRETTVPKLFPRRRMNANTGEHRAGGEEDQAPALIANALAGITPKAQAVFDLIPVEHLPDAGQRLLRDHCSPPRPSRCGAPDIRSMSFSRVGRTRQPWSRPSLNAPFFDCLS